MPSKNKSIEDLDESDFEAEWTKAAEELDAARERCKAFRAEADRRAARKTIENMDPAVRDALTQYVKVEGIASEESVHNG